MKTLNFILITAVCLSTIGCSSLSGLIPMRPAALNESVYYSQLVQNNPTSFEIFNNNPYALRLEIEETAPDSNWIPVRGDGGASLNAYAACLRLKVMF
ncbi:MAG: hypothetical protein JJV98_16150 [Desulfosarcina sp.]|nr:hypothetical protein [Desulfobacterales bacterium]